jgi:hypothetical protein
MSATDPFNSLLAQDIQPNGQPSPAAVRAQYVEQITNASTNFPKIMVQGLNQLMGLFYNRETNPQKLADALDAKHGKGFTKTLFEKHKATAEFLAEHTAPVAASIQAPPAHWVVTFNDDDSVTIVEKEQ